MRIGRITAPPHPSAHRRRLWRRPRKSKRGYKRQPRHYQKPPQPYRVGEFVAAYLTAVAVLTSFAAVLGGTGQPAAVPMIGFAYFGCGIGLSRFLARRVRWFKQRANISAVVEVKLHTIASWPISVPHFILQVAIVKHL